MYFKFPSCAQKIPNIGASVAAVNCSSCGYPVHSYFRDYFSQLKPYKHFRNDVLIEEGFYKNGRKEFMCKTYHSKEQVALMVVYSHDSYLRGHMWKSD